MEITAYNSVRNERNGALLGRKVRSAHTWMSRLKGLLGTSSLDDGHGIWLKPCRGVHTVGLGYPIDIVFLDPNDRVTQIEPDLKPLRFCTANGRTRSVIELPIGVIEESNVRVGDQIVFESLEQSRDDSTEEAQQ